MIEQSGHAGAGSADAQYLLGLMYLNGVGVASDPAHARTLLLSAAEHGQGAAAYVLAAELAHAPDAAEGVDPQAEVATETEPDNQAEPEKQPAQENDNETDASAAAQPDGPEANPTKED